MKVRDVRDLRQDMGIPENGGAPKPIPPSQLPRKLASDLEAEFGPRWVTRFPRLPFVAQYLFLPHRNFRFDFAWPIEGPDVKPRRSVGGVALEIQGGIWKDKGSHNTGSGLTRDFEKLNFAQAAGWIVFQFSDAQARDPLWLDRLAATILDRCLWYQRTQ